MNSVLALLALSAVLLLAPCGAHAAAPPHPAVARATSPHIRYQTHSYNDMREWHQVFVKGARWLKIDPHYMPASFCKSHAFGGSTDKNGCFLLSHDTPTSGRVYNSTANVLSLLADARFAGFTQAQGEPLTIALCFKGVLFPCASPHFLKAADAFVDAANNAVSAHNLNVRFVLDGAGVPKHYCLHDRWRPWVSTWISTHDPARAFTSDSTHDAYDRFQILNEPMGPPWNPGYFLAHMQARGYGKFANATRYPYLVWEPSSQKDIVEVADVYLGNQLANLTASHGARYNTSALGRVPSPRARAALHEPAGLRFAINIDQTNFDVFAASRTGNARNLHMFEGGTNPHVVVAVPNAAAEATDDPQELDMDEDFDTSTYISVLTFTRGDAQLYQMYRADTPTGAMTPLSKAPQPLELPAGMGELAGTSTIDFLGAQLVLAHDAASRYAMYSVEFDHNTLKPVQSGQLRTLDNNAGAAPEHFFAIDVEQDGNHIFLADVHNSSDCALALQLWTLDAPDSKPSLQGPRTCVVAAGALPPLAFPLTHVAKARLATVNAVQHADVALVLNKAVHGAPIGDACKEGDLRGVLAFSTLNDDLHYATLCIDVYSGDVEATLHTHKGVLVPMDVGSRVSVEVTAFNGVFLLLEAHDNGFCTHSERHNKQSQPAMCDVAATSTPRILNYNYGSLEMWEAAVARGTPLGNCNAHVLHGTYDRGTRPSVALFTTGGDAASLRVGMVEMHEGVPTGTGDDGNCGAALPWGGLVTDAWALPAADLVSNAYLSAEATEAVMARASQVWVVFAVSICLVTLYVGSFFAVPVYRRLVGGGAASYDAMAQDEEADAEYAGGEAVRSTAHYVLENDALDPEGDNAFDA